MASALTIAGAAALAQEVTFLTADGEHVTGKVVSSTLNTLNVHQTDGGYNVLPRQDITSVGMDVEGGAIQGSFINWQDGRFTLRIDDRVITVMNGVVEGGADEVVRPALQNDRPADATQGVEPDDSDLAPSVPIEHPTM